MQSPLRHHHTKGGERLPAGPPLPAAAQTLAFWRDPHSYLRWCRRRYGNTFTMRPVGKPPLVFVSNAADIKKIVTAPADVLHPGTGGEVIAPLVGASSFMIADGEEHLAGRRQILPAFHRQRMAAHAEMVRDTVVSELESWPLDAPVALHDRLRAITLRVILEAIFGADDERVIVLRARLLAMFSVSDSLALHTPRLRYAPPWRGMWQHFASARETVNVLLTQLMEDQRQSHVDEHRPLARLRAASHTNGDQSSDGRSTLMSLILAGHETTAAELAWAVQLLAHHPDVAQRLAHELENDDQEGYLDAVINEVLRHRPVFLFTIPRAVAKPIDIAGHTYHPPVHLVGCVHLLHHDEAYYTHPDSFRPERFMGVVSPPDVWMPWGGGRKRCPGHHLALLEMRTALRALLERLTIEPTSARIETARWRTVIVTPGNGCRVVLRKRRSRTARPTNQSRRF